jgi:hypothetical protein
LAILTPFSLIPSDMMPKGASAISDLATRIYDKFKAFIEDNLPKEVEEAWLRLRVKVSQPTHGSSGQRTLVEIAAIDFPLATSKSTKVRRGKSKPRS